MIQHLRSALAARNCAGVPDAQLLERFLGQRDEAAFELLVWRHGKMVFGTCRRLLRDAQEAEDAFQACFLALARRAGSIGRRESVGGWLHKVAYRVALGAKGRRTRRDAREQPLGDLTPMAPPADPASEAARQEVWRVLDDEVGRLPDRYRVPFVLCHLEGRSNADAAREIGCPLGTVESRLTRARKLLRGRLSRRGVMLSAGLLATLLGHDAASACVPAALAASTAKAATLFLAGQAMAAGLISTNVAAMTQGVLRAMFLTKLKTAAAILLAVALTGTGVGVVTYHTLAAEQPGSQPGDAPGRASAAGDAAKIARLIDQLGSDTFDDREKATKELDAIGAPALDALRKAARGGDPERKKRAQDLVEKIEMREEAARLLTPKRVRLAYQDTPLADAVADFCKQSGYDLILLDPDGKLKDREITLDTGEVTFWQAFDQFCRKASLVEPSRPLAAKPVGGAAAVGGGPPGAGGAGGAPRGAPGGPGAPGAPGGPGGGGGGGGGGGAFPGGPGKGGAGGLPPGEMGGTMQGPAGQPISRARRILLTDGQPQTLPTDDRTAVRVRILKADVPAAAADAELRLALEVAPEPRLRWQQTVAVRVTKATDDQGQDLEQTATGAAVPAGRGVPGLGGPPGGAPPALGGAVAGGPVGGMIVGGDSNPDLGGSVTSVWLKKGTTAAASLKEISGTITARVRDEGQPVITVADVLKSAGKTFKGTKDGSIKVIDVAKEADGRFRFRLGLEPPSDLDLTPAVLRLSSSAGRMVLSGRDRNAVDATQHELALTDDKGHVLPPFGIEFQTTAGKGIEIALTCQPLKGQGEPAKLALSVSKCVTIDVPFTLKNVPLPKGRAEK
jgi:RNA polymerase sigma factor (sigma-70 family)